MWFTLTFGLLSLLAGLNGFHCLLESALVTDLLKGYDNTVVPTTSSEPVVTVEHGVNLIRIHNFEHSELELDAWVSMMWTDSRLKWNPSDYNDVTNTNLFADQLWIPDIVSWHFKNEELMLRDLRAVVDHSGLVILMPPQRILLHCDVSTGAEEIHTCVAKFGSWTYAGSKVDIENTGGILNLDNYIVNPDWEIFNSTVVRQSSTYSCCPGEEYPLLTYTIELRPKHHRHHCY